MLINSMEESLCMYINSLYCLTILFVNYTSIKFFKKDISSEGYLHIILLSLSCSHQSESGTYLTSGLKDKLSPLLSSSSIYFELLFLICQQASTLFLLFRNLLKVYYLCMDSFPWCNGFIYVIIISLRILGGM